MTYLLDPYRRVSAVLFDMDGVLADNIPFHTDAWLTYMREAFGIELEPDAPLHFHGRTHEVIERLIGRPFSPEEASLHHEGKEAAYRDLARGRIRPVRGLGAYLDWLDVRGIRKAVVTNSDPLCMEFVLGELGIAHRFDTLVNAAQVVNAKPHPEPYLTAMRRLGVAPEDCLVHEDSAGGVRAGHAAGARVVGIATALPPETLLQAGASLVVDDFEEWRGLLQLPSREPIRTRVPEAACAA